MTPPKARYPNLDALRGIALIAAVMAHGPRVHSARPAWLAETYAWLAVKGWAGVDLFFVLSGFLVAGLLFSEFRATGSVAPLRFLVRRAFKIYPSYYFCLVTYLVLCWWTDQLRMSLVLPNFFFLQNYLGAAPLHFWSLAVEEHFYLLLAGLFYWQVRKKESAFQRLPWMFALVAVLCLIARILTTLYTETPFRFRTHLFATHLRIDTLSFGVLLAWGVYYRRQWIDHQIRSRSYRWAAATVALLLPFLLLQPRTSALFRTFGISLLYLGLGLLLLFSFYLPARAYRWLRPLCWMGRYSYGMYLWHWTIKVFCLPFAERLLGTKQGWTLNLCYWLGTIALGVASTRFIEEPLLRFRDRHFPSPEGAAAAREAHAA